MAKRGRLGRDVIAVAMIERLIAKRGARVCPQPAGTDSDDPAALLMRRLIDSFAEYERAPIAARTRAALAAKRRRGERVSGLLPFGYRLDADGRTFLPEASLVRPRSDGIARSWRLWLYQAIARPLSQRKMCDDGTLGERW